MQKYVLTTNLSPRLYEWLDKAARKLGLTKREIIEKALEHERAEEARRAIRESMIRASQDEEIKTMAEWGLQDVANQLNKIDGGYGTS